MFGIKNSLTIIWARLRWRKLNPHNKTNIGFASFGFDCVEVGYYSYGEINVLTSSHSPQIKIGSFCSIAKDVTFVVCDVHSLSTLSTFPWKVSALGETEPEALGKGGIIIGDDAWIGYRATILDDVKIGQGAVVAAGAVVMKDVVPYTIVGGVPAKSIRKRFDDAVIQKLKRVDFSSFDQEFIEKSFLRQSEDVCDRPVRRSYVVGGGR